MIATVIVSAVVSVLTTCAVMGYLTYKLSKLLNQEGNDKC